MAAPAAIRLPPNHEKGSNWALGLGSFFFAECPAKLVESDVLKLANSLTGDAKFFTDFFEGLETLAIKSETRIDDAALALVKHVEQISHFITEIFVAKGLVRIQCLLVADDITECGGVLIVDRLVERSRTNGSAFEGANF
jgi:hypothetical protein